MGKYAEALGIWELKISTITFRLKPKKGDSLKLYEIAKEAKGKDVGIDILKQFKEFIYSVIIRDYPPTTQEEGEELEALIEMNIQDLIERTVVAFRLAKPEDFIKKKEEEKKVDTQ